MSIMHTIFFRIICKVHNTNIYKNSIEHDMNIDETKIKRASVPIEPIYIQDSNITFDKLSNVYTSQYSLLVNDYSFDDNSVTAKEVVRRTSSFTNLCKLLNQSIPDNICKIITQNQCPDERLMFYKYLAYVANNIANYTYNDYLCKYHSNNTNKLYSNAATISGYLKLNGNEDAYFNNKRYAGVADGIGEWESYGIQAKEFALYLMDRCNEISMKIEDINEKFPSLTCKAVLARAYNDLLQSEKHFGSSTAIVVGISKDGSKLGIAALGDSVCFVLRRNYPHVTQMTIIKRTEEQQHYFNCPYQLTKFPTLKEIDKYIEEPGKYLLKTLLTQSENHIACSVDNARLYDINIQKGDLILICTDGMTDNLFDHEILWLCSLAVSKYDLEYLKSIKSNNLSPMTRKIHKKCLDMCVTYEATDPLDIANGLMEAGFNRSKAVFAKTPFSKAYGQSQHYRGGKLDDITVVACWID